MAAELLPSVKKKRMSRQTITPEENKRRHSYRSKLRRLKEVFIGDEIERWNIVKEDNALKSNVDVARLLLDLYQVYRANDPLKSCKIRDAPSVQDEDNDYEYHQNRDNSSMNPIQSLSIKDEPNSDDSCQNLHVVPSLADQDDVKTESFNLDESSKSVKKESGSRSCGVPRSVSSKKMNKNHRTFRNREHIQREEQEKDGSCYMYNQLPSVAVNSDKVEEDNRCETVSASTEQQDQIYFGDEADVSSNEFSECESVGDLYVRYKSDLTHNKDDGYRKKRKRKNPRRIMSARVKEAVNKVNKKGSNNMVLDSMQNPDVMQLSDKEFGCTYCTQIYSKLEDAREHILTHYEFHCNHCDQRFLTSHHLKLHIENQHGNNTLNCLVSSCDFTARSMKDISKHISLQHVNEDVYKCAQCSHVSRSTLEFQKHISVSHGVSHSTEGGLCYICGTMKKCLREHLYTVHDAPGYRYGPRRKTLMCEICGMELPNRLQLKSHRLAWHTEKNIPCRFIGCTVLFKTNGHMETHYKTVHLGIKRYNCPYEGCAFRSVNKTTFVNHTKAIHLKIRSHPCSWPSCTKSFFDKKHLVMHQRIHYDIKPLRCDFCDYRCRQRTSLNWHITKKHKEATTDFLSMVPKEMHPVMMQGIQGISDDIASVTSAHKPSHYNVPIGIPAVSHALKPGRKKKNN